MNKVEESKFAMTEEERKIVDKWAGELMAAMLISPQNFGNGPLEVARQAYTFAIKLLEVRRDIHK